MGSEEDYNSSSSSKLIVRLCDKMALHLFGRRSSFALEDLLNLIWLYASPNDLKTMKAMFREISEETTRVRVNAPPVLDSCDYEDLRAVFKHFDSDHCGELSFDKLVRLGL